MNDLIQNNEKIFPAKNAMKRHNYYPHRGYYGNSNGIFFTQEELKDQVSQQINMLNA